MIQVGELGECCGLDGASSKNAPTQVLSSSCSRRKSAGAMGQETLLEPKRSEISTSVAHAA